MPDRKLTLKANYEGSGRQYEIRFALGGIGAAISPVMRAGGSALGDLPVPSDESGVWNFAGWYRDDGFRSPVDPASELVRGNLTLYARWSKMAVPAMYSVTVSSTAGGRASASAASDRKSVV